MNKLLADLNVLYVKLHTLHYNVIGADFVPTHLFLEGEYDLVHEWIDGVAERIKMDGDKPLTTVTKMLEVSTIKEADLDEVSTTEALALVKADYEMLLSDIRALGETTSKLTTNMLEDIEAELDKKIWFINSMSK